MKQQRNLFLFLLIMIRSCFSVSGQMKPDQMIGAWETVTGDQKIVMICSEKYFAAAVYNTRDNSFIGTCGGSYAVHQNTFFETHEFNTMHPERIGRELQNKVDIKN